MQEIGPLVKADAGQMRNVTAQMLRKVMQDCARSADCCSPPFKSETIQSGDLEMIANRENRRVGSEHPIFVTIYNPKGLADQFVNSSVLARENDFSGTESFQFSQEARLMFDFGDAECSRREIDK